MKVQETRYRSLNSKPIQKGPVLYWMDRERRMRDNWAFFRAQEIAREHDQLLQVVYVFPKTFLDSAWRQHHFMLKAFQEMQEDFAEKNICFNLHLGDPVDVIKKIVQEGGFGTVITEMSPLKLPRSWRDQLAKSVDCRFEEVDARNIVPVWEASPKKEFGAYTLRPKIHKKLDEYLEDFPYIMAQDEMLGKVEPIDIDEVQKFLEVDKNIPPVDWIEPGEKAAHKMLDDFLEERLEGYDEKRNDPLEDAQSELSPYLHFGMISAQRIALKVNELRSHAKDREAFLEEMIVRRELSDNFCFYNKDYDKPEGFPDWAKKTLSEHADDKREYNYSLEEFEKAKTHDPLWNAAQMQMVKTGKMHGYMRMYWCKKILEWTENPRKAMEIAIYLNDAYELDGRDSNGYTGVAWSIGGVHDRAWAERDVFGKIRYMNYKGCKRKFNVQNYIETWLGTDQEQLFS